MAEIKIGKRIFEDWRDDTFYAHWGHKWKFVRAFWEFEPLLEWEDTESVVKKQSSRSWICLESQKHLGGEDDMELYVRFGQDVSDLDELYSGPRMFKTKEWNLGIEQAKQTIDEFLTRMSKLESFE